MDSPVLLFDGLCNLCSRLVKFILKYEKNNAILFIPLQSSLAGKLLQQHHLELSKDSGTIVFIEDGKAYVESEAVFKIAGYLKNPFSFIRIFSIMPKFLNDFIYKIVSKYRYRVFGKSAQCMVPDGNLKNRFPE